MGYTVEAKKFQIPVHMKEAALDLFNYLSEAPSGLGIIEFGVFGSVARGQSRWNSDLDVLVITSGNLKSARWYCTHERCSERTDIAVDIVITDKEWSTAAPLFRRNLERDYVPIWRMNDE